jgi:branched-subunit amino acid transport protein
MRTALAITAVGALSYVLRVVPLVAIGRVDIGPRLDRAIRHAGAAAVTALFVGAVLHGGGGGPRPAVLVAAGAALWAATRGAAMLRVVLVGAVSYGALCVAAAVW